MSFNPPSGVTNGAEYTYGNVVWRFDGDSGVWNIVDGSVIGSQGPQGDPGAPGAQGNTGSTGPTGAGAATGDSGAFIVTDGVGTVRRATTGATGVASFDPRYFDVGASAHIKLGGTLGGIVISDQSKQEDAFGWGEVIDISGTGGILFNKIAKGAYQIVPTGQVLGVTGIGFSTTDTGLTGKINLTAGNGLNLTRSGNTLAYSAQNFVIRDAFDTDSTNMLGIGQFTITGGTGISVIAFGSKDGVSVSSQIADSGGVAGIAWFEPSYFTTRASDGRVTLSSAYAVTGDTVQAGSAINIGTGKIINNIGVTAFNGATGAMTVTGSQHGVPYINTSFRAQGGLTASSTFVFNGTSLTFGSTTSTFTVTGPNIVLGAATEITGGVFKNPTEAAPHYTITTTNDIVVNGISGSIQRYTITPNGKVTIKAGTGWHALSTATETIALIIQNKSSFTGSFDSSILVDGSGSPILFGPDTTTNYGVTGGVSVVTLMRVNKGGGAGLTMGFVISTGMTAANVTIN
jgi:hypothetical protein